MIEKIMKAVKRGNKKRGKNITVGAVVGMLLSCTVVMGAGEIGLEIVDGDEEGIKFSKDGKEFVPGDFENDPYFNNIWDKIEKSYTNNSIIAGVSSDSKTSYGLNITNINEYGKKSKINNIINNALITSYSDNTSTGESWGINIESNINKALTNNGLIDARIQNTSSSSGSYGIVIPSVGIQIGNIENNGLINSYNNSTVSGFSSNSVGINVVIHNVSIGEILNNGLINAYSNASSGGRNSCGIELFPSGSAIVNNIINTGSIKGNGVSSGYGIYIYSTNIKNIINTGVIYGKNSAIYNAGTINGDQKNYGVLVSTSGNVVDSLSMTNYGLMIKNGAVENSYTGTNPVSVILGYNADGTPITKSMTVDNNTATGNKTDYILNALKNTYEVTDTDNNVTGSIINAYEEAVIFTTADKTLTLTNTTVNGGVKENTAAVSGSSGADTLKLENSVINGNIDMKGGSNTIDAGNNTTINGNITTENGDDTFTSGNNVAINGEINLGNGKNKIEVGNKVYINGDISTGTGGLDFTGGSEVYINGNIAFTANKDTFTLGEKSIIYKDIDMGAGNDELTIGTGSIVNATLAGGDGTDTLTFGTNSKVKSVSNTEDNINISHDITGFENINVGTKVTFANDLTITGTSNIALEKDGVLLLTLDKNDLDGNGKIKGHALYDSGITVSSTGGKMLLDLDGAKGTEIITFGNINLENSIVPGDNETLDITSKVHTIKAGDNKNEVVLVLRWSIPEILKYKGLNEVYHGIGSVNDLIGNFNIKSDEQLVTFIEYLNNIYAGNPYSYSSELSRKSAGMFRDIVVDNIFRPEKDKWMIYGGLTHVDGGTKDTYYGKGYYTYDIGSSDMDADTKITGAYMLGEYGVSDTLTSGIVIGGNKLKSDLSNGSKVDGSAMYLGAYAKKYIGNLKVTAGAGFQYGDYDADRLAVNKVASSTAESVMKYSDNYNDMTYDIYLNGRYSHNIGDNLFLEPYGTLSYTYVDQDGADEGSKALAIESDSKSFDYTVGKVGVDLKKVIPHEKGKSTLSAGVSYTKILDGADEEHITGRFKGGSNFDILVAHKNEHSIGLNAKYALELENGVIFDVKGTYSVERDSHNQSGKNRTKGEWIVGAGIGYKF